MHLATAELDDVVMAIISQKRGDFFFLLDKIFSHLFIEDYTFLRTLTAKQTFFPKVSHCKDKSTRRLE